MKQGGLSKFPVAEEFEKKKKDVLKWFSSNGLDPNHFPVHWSMIEATIKTQSTKSMILVLEKLLVQHTIVRPLEKNIERIECLIGRMKVALSKPSDILEKEDTKNRLAKANRLLELLTFCQGCVLVRPLLYKELGLSILKMNQTNQKNPTNAKAERKVNFKVIR